MPKVDHAKFIVFVLGFVFCVVILLVYTNSIGQLLVGLAIILLILAAYTLFMARYKSRGFTSLIERVGEAKNYDELPVDGRTVRGYCAYKGALFNIKIGVTSEGMYFYKQGCFCTFIKWSDIENITGNEDRKTVSLGVDGVQEVFSVPWTKSFSAIIVKD